MNIVIKGLKILREEGVKVFIQRVSSYALSRTLGRILSFLIIVIKFRNVTRSINNIHDALDFAFLFQAFGVSIKPTQVKYEIAKLLEIVAALRPRVVLEIGTAGGGTLFLFTRAADPDAKIISIDLPGGPFGGGYPKWKTPLYKSFSKEGQKIYLIRRDSHDPQTLEEVKRILGDEKVDFLFIDGDHTYEGVKRDFEIYSPLVREGGIIAFHDIVPGPPENVGGVPEFWNKIKTRYRHLEIVRDWSQGGFGIGVIYMTQRQSSPSPARLPRS
jgi:predicted O-methyltransferase YrrM